jgi:hypothetical protein
LTQRTGLAVASVRPSDATEANTASGRSADEKNASDGYNNAKTTENESGEWRRALRGRPELRHADDQGRDEGGQTDDGEQHSEYQSNRLFGAGVHFNSLGKMHKAPGTRTSPARPERRHSAAPLRGRM